MTNGFQHPKQILRLSESKYRRNILNCVNSLCGRVNQIKSAAVIKRIQNCSSPNFKINKNVFEIFKFVLTKPWFSEKLNSRVILWNKIQFSEPYWIILSTFESQTLLANSSISKVCHERVKERENKKLMVIVSNYSFYTVEEI